MLIRQVGRHKKEPRAELFFNMLFVYFFEGLVDVLSVIILFKDSAILSVLRIVRFVDFICAYTIPVIETLNSATIYSRIATRVDIICITAIDLPYSKIYICIFALLSIFYLIAHCPMVRTAAAAEK